RNRELARQLESRGLMTESGRAKIEIARQNGSRDSSKPGPLSDDQLRSFEALLQPHGAALANFAKMPPSMRRTYASSYLLGAKTDEGKRRRLAAIVERLELNLNPMESLKSRQTK
ncbi:MAG: YdeI/OmpD-associated family protein, partial [Candidatus Eisenbacteria bacterium]|nr:YdeI/OmpD-associated family protein [Candidatus Eisenbacteria bacterium]